MINSVLNSVKIIASGRIQVEPRQMPVCMKLGSSSHIEALVSMIELRNQIYTGGPRRLSNCIYATYECICVKYSAKSYVVSTLVCVGFVELFGVRFFTKQSSQRAYFYFNSPLYTRVWFCCAWCNSMAAFGYIWVLFVAPWCLCYRTSKSRLSDNAIKPMHLEITREISQADKRTFW